MTMSARDEFPLSDEFELRAFHRLISLTNYEAMCDRIDGLTTQLAMQVEQWNRLMDTNATLTAENAELRQWKLGHAPGTQDDAPEVEPREPWEATP